MAKKASLIIAASENDANLFYVTRFSVPDPVIFFETGGEKHLVLSDLEIDRARLEAEVHHFHSLSSLAKGLSSKQKKSGIPYYALIVDTLFRSKKIREIEVPSSFPSLYYEALKKLGYKIKIKPDPFYEQRLVKSDQEKKAIRHTLLQVEKTLKEAFQLIERSKINGNKICHGKEVVTSEMMRKFINTRLMERGCVASHTIIASGVQGSLPHHCGSGPLMPHTPIIFDIFPRDGKSRYNGDMTRTIVKGKPTPEAKKMFQTVQEANKRGQDLVRPGVTGAEIHKEVSEHIKNCGFKTGQTNGQMEGFIHSTGHGLGLDVHEAPSVSTVGGPLKEGYVITIEPGLYYKKYGGIRLEDVVYVTRTGHETLTQFPTFFEIDRG